MSFHAGFAPKKTPSRSSNSSTDSLKRKSGDLQQDAENKSPNIKTASDTGSVKKTRVTRSASGPSTSGLQPPRAGRGLSKLPAPRASKLPSKPLAPETRRRAAAEKSTSERVHASKTPTKVYTDRSSLMSPGAGSSSSSSSSSSNSKAEKTPTSKSGSTMTMPSSVLKFPKQCLREKIKGYFERAPIKSEEEINQIIIPKMKTKSKKFVDFREKAKCQAEVIADLRGLLKETLHEFKVVEQKCVGAEKEMEDEYGEIRMALKEKLNYNNDLKANEAQLQSEYSQLLCKHDAQNLEVEDLKSIQSELTENKNELTKMVAEFADKLRIESEVRTQVEALLETTKNDLSAAVEEKVVMVKDLKDSQEKVNYEHSISQSIIIPLASIKL